VSSSACSADQPVRRWSGRSNDANCRAGSRPVGER
jgi:hypothetical protein